MLYATWLDDQIHTGNDMVKWRDSTVHDHPIPGKRCEVPDVVGPPISYMEKVKVFKPAEFAHNPKGLCRFYHMSPGKSNVLVGLRSAASASPPSPESAGTRAATYGGSSRRGIHYSLVSTG